LIDRFFETVPPVWHAVRSHIHTLAVQEHDISVEQFHVLRHISKGVDSVSALAEVKRISRPAISQAVNGLVDKGYITRTTGEHDRRYIHLCLTETGRSVLDKIFSATRDWMSAELSSLTNIEIDQVIAGLSLLKRGMEE
jgi:DNA-binding MarR family transcriptional regulator